MTDLEHRTGDGRRRARRARHRRRRPVPGPRPGRAEHLPRLTDVDEDAADRATRQVATMFGLVPILALIFVVNYFAIPQDAYIDFGPLHTNLQNVVFGLTLGLALVLIGLGAIQWARQLMDDHEAVDYRHGASSSDEDRAESSSCSRRASTSPRSPGARCWAAACSALSVWWPCPGSCCWPTSGRGRPGSSSRRPSRRRSGRKASGWSTTSPTSRSRPTRSRSASWSTPSRRTCRTTTGPSSCRRRPRPPSSSCG